MRLVDLFEENATEIGISRRDEMIGDGETAVLRRRYMVTGVPGLNAVLHVLDYGKRDPGRVVHTIEVWPAKWQGKGYAQRLYMAALEDGPLTERPNFRSDEAGRAVERLITKGLIRRDTNARGLPVLSKTGTYHEAH